MVPPYLLQVLPDASTGALDASIVVNCSAPLNISSQIAGRAAREVLLSGFSQV